MSEIALVTGCSGSLGAAVAQQLAASGYRLVLTGRDAEKLNANPIADGLKISADLSCPEAIDELFLAIKNQYGAPPSLLAHCAGSIVIRPMHRTTHEQYRTCLQNNLDSAFFTLQRFIMGLIELKSGGAAVLVSSIAGRIGIGNHAAIAAAKAGVEGLIRSAAADYAGRGVRINGIAPGLMRSTATEGYFSGATAEKQLAGQYPLGRYGHVDDAAHAICWLLSDEANWVTGQVLAIDGGFSSIRPLVKR